VIRLLKFYVKESLIYRDYRTWPYDITREQTVKAVQVVCQRYGLKIPEVKFTGRTRHFCLWAEDVLRFVPGCITVEDVAHELAHYIRSRVYGCHRHFEPLMDLIGELIPIVLEAVGKKPLS